MGDRVMMKLSSGEEVCPFLRIVGTEDAKICFNLLVGPFGLSIRLRVICSGEFDIVMEELCKFSGKCRSELRTSVGYQGVVEAKAFEYVVEEMFGYSGCVYGFRARNENYPLHKAVVDHDHQ